MNQWVNRSINRSTNHWASTNIQSIYQYQVHDQPNNKPITLTILSQQSNLLINQTKQPMTIQSTNHEPTESSNQPTTIHSTSQPIRQPTNQTTNQPSRPINQRPFNKPTQQLSRSGKYSTYARTTCINTSINQPINQAISLRGTNQPTAVASWADYAKYYERRARWLPGRAA